MKFLEIFLPAALAKRFIALILLAVGIPVKTAAGLTGLTDLFITAARHEHLLSLPLTVAEIKTEAVYM